MISRPRPMTGCLTFCIVWAGLCAPAWPSPTPADLAACRARAVAALDHCLASSTAKPAHGCWDRSRQEYLRCREAVASDHDRQQHRARARAAAQSAREAASAAPVPTTPSR